MCACNTHGMRRKAQHWALSIKVKAGLRNFLLFTQIQTAKYCILPLTHASDIKLHASICFH